MEQLELCLEEYTEFVKQYSYEEPYRYLINKVTSIAIYYVQAEEKCETTAVPILKGEQHQVSGNNKDGFVVTVWTEQGSDDGEY